MGEVETFAHDLHTYLTTGVPLAIVTIDMTFNTDEAVFTTEEPLTARPASGATRANPRQAGVSS